MELLEAIKKHEKDFEKWWFDGEDFSPSLEEALVEVYEDVMPPGIGIQKGIDSDTSEWLNDYVPQDVLDIRYQIDKVLKNLNFIKRLIEKIRIIFRDKKLRASNTKITLTWTIDKNEMRGSKQNIKEHILNKLKDYVGDVTLFRLPILTNIIPNKNNLLIFCSKEDFELYSSEMKKKFESDIISLKANYILEVVE